MKHLSQAPRYQLGLSLVEMMVGVAIGLFVIAAAATLVSMQLGDNRRILLETQVQQDLRATADIITRELRRAGYWSSAEDGLASGAAPIRNSYLGLTFPSTSEVGYEYQRTLGVSGPFGFKLDAGVIKIDLSNTPPVWQELTDKNVLVIDDLNIALEDSDMVRLPCPKVCPSPPPAGEPAEYCWPQIGVRSLRVTITGHALSDPAVKRTVQSQVRLRNDEVRFRAGNVLDPQVCPT